MLLLYKRKARSAPTNYRGIHLTNQLSKVVERCVGMLFLPRLQHLGFYGPRQFAYGQGRSYKDALALCVCDWIWALCHKCRIGLYCSDVASAFDRVSSKRLVLVLSKLHLHEDIFKLLSSWLECRSAYVIVDNERSRHFCLKDMVFQGTVLGPPLWNLFFASIREVVNALSFKEVVFADDLNSYRKYHFDASHSSIMKDLTCCQSNVHKWGRHNQVEFESSKESLHILCSKQPKGDAFKILGITFDTKLVMYEAVVIIVAECGCRIKMLMRVRPFYSIGALVGLYKSLFVLLLTVEHLQSIMQRRPF